MCESTAVFNFEFERQFKRSQTRGSIFSKLFRVSFTQSFVIILFLNVCASLTHTHAAATITGTGRKVTIADTGRTSYYLADRTCAVLQSSKVYSSLNTYNTSSAETPPLCDQWKLPRQVKAAGKRIEPHSQVSNLKSHGSERYGGSIGPLFSESSLRVPFAEPESTREQAKIAVATTSLRRNQTQLALLKSTQLLQQFETSQNIQWNKEDHSSSTLTTHLSTTKRLRQTNAEHPLPSTGKGQHPAEALRTKAEEEAAMPPKKQRTDTDDIMAETEAAATIKDLAKTAGKPEPSASQPKKAKPPLAAKPAQVAKKSLHAPPPTKISDVTVNLRAKDMAMIDKIMPLPSDYDCTDHYDSLLSTAEEIRTYAEQRGASHLAWVPAAMLRTLHHLNLTNVNSDRGYEFHTLVLGSHFRLKHFSAAYYGQDTRSLELRVEEALGSVAKEVTVEGFIEGKKKDEVTIRIRTHASSDLFAIYRALKRVLKDPAQFFANATLIDERKNQYIGFPFIALESQLNPETEKERTVVKTVKITIHDNAYKGQFGSDQLGGLAAGTKAILQEAIQTIWKESVPELKGAEAITNEHLTLQSETLTQHPLRLLEFGRVTNAGMGQVALEMATKAHALAMSNLDNLKVTIDYKATVELTEVTVPVEHLAWGIAIHVPSGKKVPTEVDLENLAIQLHNYAVLGYRSALTMLGGEEPAEEMEIAFVDSEGFEHAVNDLSEESIVDVVYASSGLPLKSLDRSVWRKTCTEGGKPGGHFIIAVKSAAEAFAVLTGVVIDGTPKPDIGWAGSTFSLTRWCPALGEQIPALGTMAEKDNAEFEKLLRLARGIKNRVPPSIMNMCAPQFKLWGQSLCALLKNQATPEKKKLATSSIWDQAAMGFKVHEVTEGSQAEPDEAKKLLGQMSARHPRDGNWLKNAKASQVTNYPKTPNTTTIAKLTPNTPMIGAKLPGWQQEAQPGQKQGWP